MIRTVTPSILKGSDKIPVMLVGYVTWNLGLVFRIYSTRFTTEIYLERTHVGSSTESNIRIFGHCIMKCEWGYGVFHSRISTVRDTRALSSCLSIGKDTYRQYCSHCVYVVGIGEILKGKIR